MTWQPEPGFLEAYRRDGYVLARGLFSEEEAARMRGFAAELLASEPAPGGIMKYGDDAAADEGRSVLSRIEHMRGSHQGLRAVMEGGRLLVPLALILAEPPVLFKDKINYKLPGSSGFEPHQDVQAGWERYCATHVTAMVSLDATTPENGCLELAPGHHRRGTIGAAWTPLEGDALRGLEFVPMPTSPGDVCFFDSRTPHRSAPNRTPEPRRVLYLTYNPVSQGDHYEAYFADKRRDYPPDAEREPGRSYRYRV